MALSLDASTPPELVASHFAQHGTLNGVHIDPGVGVAELEQIARLHLGHDHDECVLDLVIAHPAADADLLEVIFGLAPDSSQVANSITMSSKAPVALLQKLAASDSPGVRDHVQMALLERELAVADDAGFMAALQRLKDHDTLGYGVRYRLATHPRTPAAVLKHIATFADETGQTARDRLASG
ncbi:MAG: hypothetical protein AAF721_15395 [Myxococcota bacterium]